MNNQENRIKISNHQRIRRILDKICQASLPVIVRGSGSSAVSVKGRAATIISYGPNNLPVIRIANISDKGISHIVAAGRIQVEFVMMATKVVFLSQLVAREDQSILITFPQNLVSIERRKNARYTCTDDLKAFLDLSAWHADIDDLSSPPFFPQFKNISGYISVADLSFGGLCGVTRFPSSSLVMKRGVIDDRASLILPMIGRIPISIEIRWIKRIKEHHKDKSGQEIQRRFYKFGAEFVTQSDHLKVSLRQFIAKISQAGAI